jgi:carbamoyltransferase
MYTLGINAAFHDSSACLVEDGRVVAAVEEERFTRIKHGKRPVPFSTWELPFHAIDYCLREAAIPLTDVVHVAYAFDPALQVRGSLDQATVTLPLQPSTHPVPAEWEAAWDPLFVASIVNAPRHLASGAPHHLAARFKGARADGPYQWHFVEHHVAHAASAFLASPFERAAVLTLDGRGERATTGYFQGCGNQLWSIGDVRMPHSLGILYEQVTEYLGFLHSSDEYKVMALASYGEPTVVDTFRGIIHRGENGAYVIEPPCLEQRFGPPRARGGPLEQLHFDIAHSLQVVLEETVLDLVHWLQATTGERDLCLAGGVALNCVMNARIRDEGPFDRVWGQPAAGDAGTALGVALWVDAQERRDTERRYQMDNAYLGPCYPDAEIESFLTWSKLSYRRLDDVPQEAAALLAAGRILGWFQGRMEFGPRALGARSILASPIDPDMQSRLNEIKDREDFRPVAPVVLAEKASEWFVTDGDSPFMLFVHDVRDEMADRIPAVRHVDGTARIQTISRSQHPLYYDLIAAFEQQTGVPVLVNTSFNTRGEPIVCSPRDAVECFWTSPLDALVIGPFLLQKSEGPL